MDLVALFLLRYAVYSTTLRFRLEILSRQAVSSTAPQFRLPILSVSHHIFPSSRFCFTPTTGVFDSGQHDHRAVLIAKREYDGKRDTLAKKCICGAERGEADSPETVI
jgi:hypothetical protein